MIDDTGAQGEVSVEEGIGKRDAPAADDSVEDLAVEFVAISRRPGVSKTHGAARNAFVDMRKSWSTGIDRTA